MVCRVLVFDSNEDMADTVSLYLNRHGHRVRTLTDPHRLKYQDGTKFHIAIVDYRFVDSRFSDGEEFATELKRQNPELLAIIITRFPEDSEEAKLLEEDDFPIIYKPFDFDILEKYIQWHFKDKSPEELGHEY